MTLAEIATISGKGGLFKVIAPTKSGVILESLDEAKTKMVATTNHRLSLLNEISIYTTTKEGTVALEDVLKKINKEYGEDTGVDPNSDPAELKSFLKSILPDYDEVRVYVSDIKKLVKWYAVILKYAPEVIHGDSAEKSDDKEGGAEPKSETKKKPEVKEKSETKEKPEPKAKSEAKEKPESKQKSQSKEKPAAKEKSKGGSKSKTTGKKKK